MCPYSTFKTYEARGRCEVFQTPVCIHLTAATYASCTFNPLSGRRSDTTHYNTLQSMDINIATNRRKARVCESKKMEGLRSRLGEICLEIYTCDRNHRINEDGRMFPAIQTDSVSLSLQAIIEC